MPTGYTAQITPTMSLKEWVLRVAINPDRTPDDGSVKYYEENIEREEKELQTLQQAGPIELKMQLEKHQKDNASSMEEAIRENKELEKSLLSILPRYCRRVESL